MRNRSGISDTLTRPVSVASRSSLWSMSSGRSMVRDMMPVQRVPGSPEIAGEGGDFSPGGGEIQNGCPPRSRGLRRRRRVRRGRRAGVGGPPDPLAAFVAEIGPMPFGPEQLVAAQRPLQPLEYGYHASPRRNAAATLGDPSGPCQPEFGEPRSASRGRVRRSPGRSRARIRDVHPNPEELVRGA